MPNNDIFKPLKKSARSSEILAEEIQKVIIDGIIKPGEHLPSERNLAETFNVTRNTVREALRTLEQLRLVSIRQGSRITVLDYLTTAGFDFVAELFRTSEKGVANLMEDIADAWSVIGKAMMFYAIDKFDQNFFPQLSAAVHAFAKEASKKSPDMLCLQGLDFEIQNRLMQATGNQAMILLHNSIRNIYSHIAELFTPVVSDPEFMAKNYINMEKCLESNDKNGAQKAFRAYFDQGKDALAGKKQP